MYEEFKQLALEDGQQGYRYIYFNSLIIFINV